jgi:hypothetical protein
LLESGKEDSPTSAIPIKTVFCGSSHFCTGSTLPYLTMKHSSYSIPNGWDVRNHTELFQN